MRRLALSLLVLLAACAPPRDTCERRVALEIERLEELIVETRAALARGYRFEYSRRGGTGLTLCTGGGDVAFCTATGGGTIRRTVAIDPAAEQRKLELLEGRRARLVETGA